MYLVLAEESLPASPLPKKKWFSDTRFNLATSIQKWSWRTLIMEKKQHPLTWRWDWCLLGVFLGFNMASWRKSVHQEVASLDPPIYMSFLSPFWTTVPCQSGSMHEAALHGLQMNCCSDACNHAILYIAIKKVKYRRPQHSLRKMLKNILIKLVCNCSNIPHSEKPDL